MNGDKLQRAWQAVLKLGYRLEDFKLETYRVSGSSFPIIPIFGIAVRLTYLPKKLQVCCQYFRTREENLIGCLAMFTAHDKFGWKLPQEYDELGFDRMKERFSISEIIDTKFSYSFYNSDIKLIYKSKS